MRVEVYYYGSVNVLAGSAEEAVRNVRSRFGSEMGLRRVWEQDGKFLGALSFHPDIRKDPDFLKKKAELFRLHGRIPVIFHGETITEAGSKQEAELKFTEAVGMLFKPEEKLNLLIDSLEVDED
ncbi:MAG: hypothetical protein QXF14_04120 [Candidatus Woesearchaeota archaeon]